MIPQEMPEAKRGEDIIPQEMPETKRVEDVFPQEMPEATGQRPFSRGATQDHLSCFLSRRPNGVTEAKRDNDNFQGRRGRITCLVSSPGGQTGQRGFSGAGGRGRITYC